MGLLRKLFCFVNWKFITIRWDDVGDYLEMKVLRQRMIDLDERRRGLDPESDEAKEILGLIKTHESTLLKVNGCISVRENIRRQKATIQ